MMIFPAFVKGMFKFFKHGISPLRIMGTKASTNMTFVSDSHATGTGKS